MDEIKKDLIELFPTAMDKKCYHSLIQEGTKQIGITENTAYCPFTVRKEAFTQPKWKLPLSLIEKWHDIECNWTRSYTPHPTPLFIHPSPYQDTLILKQDDVSLQKK